MIISRSPLRITLGGGGTDLSEYYSNYGGFVISAAIDQYVFVTIHHTHFDHMLVRYSKIEHVKDINDIVHPIIREALKLLDINEINVEITSIADQPYGTGLGSSGSFTTSLLKALHAFKKQTISTDQLAEMACFLEVDLLESPTGKQDQYIAAFGGLTTFEFKKDGQVKAKPLKVSRETIRKLEENLVMFFTGYRRSANTVFAENKKSKESKTDKLHKIKELGYLSLEALESGNLHQFGKIMNDHWSYKKESSSTVTNKEIDRLYNLALDNGAVGGKLVGAGGGGFLIFYTEQKERLLKTLKESGLREVEIHFDYEGTKLL